MNEARYQIYSQYLKKKFGEKVYKISVNLPGTCPNRDGTLGLGGCIFCDEEGSGFEGLDNTLSIDQQIQENKAFFKRRFGVSKFIAYFQSFTNTYLPLEEFKKNMLAAASDEDVIGISISTRPDCIEDSYLDFLKELQVEKNIDINIELGLQTVNYHTLNKINRGHTLAEFIDAVLRIKAHGFETVAHIILNLPGDTMDDVIENAKVLSALGVDQVKLHSLYIVKGTKLGDLYEEGEIDLISLDDYIERVITFIEYLDPGIIIQRLLGKGPQKTLLFCNWDTSWWAIKDRIELNLFQRNIYQGDKCDYLNGKALKKR